MNVSHHSMPQPQALASRRGLIVWVTLVTEMTCLIKGWPFAAGMPQYLRPAVPACLSDLGLASQGFVQQIMANLAPASAPLVSPSSLVSSRHSVSSSYMSSFPGSPDEAAQARLIGGWTFVSNVAKKSGGWRWRRGGMVEKITAPSIISCS